MNEQRKDVIGDLELVKRRVSRLEGFGEEGEVIDSAIVLLKAQAPRLVTEEDFDNPQWADEAEYMPCWGESLVHDETYAAMITREEFKETPSGMRYWTSRPSNEQRRAVPWLD